MQEEAGSLCHLIAAVSEGLVWASSSLECWKGVAAGYEWGASYGRNRGMDHHTKTHAIIYIYITATASLPLSTSLTITTTIPYPRVEEEEEEEGGGARLLSGSCCGTAETAAEEEEEEAVGAWKDAVSLFFL